MWPHGPQGTAGVAESQIVRLITRNDTSLAMALVAAAVILFRQPLRYLFDAAHEFESRYQVDLIPALILLVVVFVFHEYQKHAQAKADARTAAAEAEQARTRSEELEELMAFGQALANALDPATLQQSLWKFLPRFSHNRSFWVLTRRGDRWDALLHDAAETRSLERLEQLAVEAVSPQTCRVDPDGVIEEEDFCVPLIAAGGPVGVMGVRNTPPLGPEERKALGAAAALIAISVRNMQLFFETRELSLRDALTGCFNRAHGLETLDSELRRSRRSGRPVSILMFDVDHFKTVNDQLGHLRGDELLQRVGIHLTKVLRSTDVRCRYGGDEFLVILPDTPSIGAEQVAECVRKEIATISVSGEDKTLQITASLGAATSNAGDRSAASLIERADAALYQAKRGGRDRYCLAPNAAGPTAAATLQLVR
jgi:diguanylate cyclase (GGDEF)-like protein